MSKGPIAKFDNDYRYLSNFYVAPVEFEGDWYPSTEHAFQAAKTLDPAVRKQIRNCKTPGLAKKMGRSVHIRPSWDQIKVQIMEALVLSKFETHEDIRKQLIETGDREIIEGNSWGDHFWGCDSETGKGENNLGKILMAVRKKLKP